MIFSIQSNVMHGYVGNRASLPFYHASGLETCQLDTVRLAAHPGYGTTARDVICAQSMTRLFDDYLKLSDTNTITACHTGYFGTADQVSATASFIKALQQRNPDMHVLVDPVFGDKGRSYVPEDVITAIIECLLPLADILTPNQFELSYLTNQPLDSLDQAKSALHHLISKPNQMALATGIGNKATIHDLCLHKGQIYDISAPLLDYGVSGAGDAFASLFLSQIIKGQIIKGQIIKGQAIKTALHTASNITHHIVRHSQSPLTMNIESGLHAYQAMLKRAANP